MNRVDHKSQTPLNPMMNNSRTGQFVQNVAQKMLVITEIT